MLPFRDRVIKILQGNEVDSGHIVFVGRVKPTILTHRNCDTKSVKVIHTSPSGIEKNLALWFPR